MEQENYMVISKTYREDCSWNGIDQESLKIFFGYLTLNSTGRYSLLSIEPPQDSCTTYVLEVEKKKKKTNERCFFFLTQSYCLVPKDQKSSLS